MVDEKKRKGRDLGRRGLRIGGPILPNSGVNRFYLTEKRVIWRRGLALRGAVREGPAVVGGEKLNRG